MRFWHREKFILISQKCSLLQYSITTAGNVKNTIRNAIERKKMQSTEQEC